MAPDGSIEMGRYDLSEFERRVIAPLLPSKPRGVARVDDRRVLNEIFWVLRSGSPWRDLPERFGDPIKVHTRFSRWEKGSVWKKLFEMLAADADNEYAMIDSTIVRAHQHSAGAQKKTVKTRRSGAAKAG